MKNSLGGVAIASTSVLKLVRIIQKIGKKITAAADQPAIVRMIRWRVLRCMAITQSAMFFAIERTRKIATMLARITAITPAADAPPMSYSRNARR